MPLLDKKGRLLGRFNIFDLFVVCVVAALAAIAYVKLSAPQRVAPPFASAETRVTVAVTLQLPEDQPWMCDYAKSGLAETDPRTGEPVAEVLGCNVRDGFPTVDLRLHAVRDDAGHILFEGHPLLPGRALELNTDAAIFSGVVRSMTLEAP